MKKRQEEELKSKTKQLSVKEGITYGVMDGAGFRYITPYALAIGANNAQIGFLTSIPSLLGNFSQLFTSKAIEKYSRKKIIAFGVFLQALMWIPIILVGYLFFNENINHGLSANLLIVFYTLMIIFGAFLSPAWNSLIRDIVCNKCGEYFGRRNKIIVAIAVGVMLVSGLVLNYFEKINYLFIGFAILFAVAFVSRMISVFLIRKHYEPKLKLEKGYYFSFIQFIKRIPQSNFGKFSVFIALVTFGVSIASPFFTVYMLKDLNFDYFTWVLVIVANSASHFIFMPIWGKFADKFGNFKVLYWTGVLIALIPFSWFLTIFTAKISLTAVLIHLLITEFFSGFVWSGFNLSAVNFIYDAVSRQKLALCVAYYNILSGVGVFLGASLGGIVSSLNINFFGIITPILFIFILSGIARFLSYLMIFKIKEVREVAKYKDGEFGKEVKQMLSPVHFIRNLPIIGSMFIK